MKPSRVRSAGAKRDVSSVKERTVSSSRAGKKDRKLEDIPSLPKKKAKLVHSTTVGNKKVTCELEFDSDRIPENGSTEMYSAIFHAAKYCGGTASVDLDKINEDVRKFWGKPLSCDTKSKKKEKPAETLTSVSNAEAETDTSDTEELLRECQRLLNDEDDNVEVTPHNDSGFVSSTSAPTRRTESPPRRTGNREPRGRQRKSKKKKTKVLDVINLLSSDDEEFVPLVPERDILEDLIFFSVIYYNNRYPMHFYKKDKVRLIRENLAKLTKLIPEGFEMFLGEDVRLEDDDTLESVQMTEHCQIDAFYTEKSLQDLYKDGAISVLRFKLQTNDRTGRQTIYVYVQQDSKMQTALQQYADHFGLDVSKMVLRFDGDTVNLDRNPSENELEGEECIDVFVLNK